MLNISHNCLILTDHLLTLCDDLQEIPLSDTYFSCFTGRSYLNADNGKYCAGYVVSTPFKIIKVGLLPLATSAQQVEIYDPTWDRISSKGKTADTKYAFGVAHDFKVLWKQQVLFTSSGDKIFNGSYVH